MRVLLVEDQRLLAEATAQVLRRNNYTVDLAYDGIDGLDQALLGVHDIILLDIMLPGIDGLSILKTLRKENITTPVLLLTAKGETDDRVAGLDGGADDYLVKPFEMDELLARLRALSRRNHLQFQPEGLLVYGDLTLNPHELMLCANNQSYKLTLKEFQLMELLLVRKESVVSKSIILEKLWDFNSDVSDHHAEVYISFLRKKLKACGSAVYIQTIRGLGYMLKLNAEGGI